MADDELDLSTLSDEELHSSFEEARDSDRSREQGET